MFNNFISIKTVKYSQLKIPISFKFRHFPARKFKFQVTGISLIRKFGLNDKEKCVVFMPTVDFGTIPSFLRIKSVYMRQFWPQIIQLLPLLKQFSDNYDNSLNFHLNGSFVFNYHLFGHILQEYENSFGKFFKSEAEFVSCLRGMLQIFERCPSQFTFCMNSRSRKQMGTLPLIASTLELPSVQASENVHFIFPNTDYCPRHIQYSYTNQVKVISDWLHRSYVHGGTGTPPVEYIRSLTIGSTEREHMLMTVLRDNIEQLIEDLKVVSFLFKLLFLKFNTYQMLVLVFNGIEYCT